MLPWGQLWLLLNEMGLATPPTLALSGGVCPHGGLESDRTGIAGALASLPGHCSSLLGLSKLHLLLQILPPASSKIPDITRSWAQKNTTNRHLLLSPVQVEPLLEAQRNPEATHLCLSGPLTLKAPDLVLCHEPRRGGLIRQEPLYQTTAL